MGTVVVTGSSTGIGLATAVRLAADHEHVWAGARDPDGAPALQAAVEAAGGRIRPVRLDVDDDASVAAAFERVRAETGPVDVLVANAGISGSSPVEDTPLATFRAQMETNFFGALRCTHEVVGPMRERGSGSIVLMSSLAGRFVRAGMGAYGASKHALEAAGEALAQELAPFGVRVVIVEPGVVDTPIWSKAEPPPRASSYDHVAGKTRRYYRRMLQAPSSPAEVAEVVAAAITDPEPRLRHPVGADAIAILAARPGVPDEEIVAMNALGPDEWATAWGDAFGIPLD